MPVLTLTAHRFFLHHRYPRGVDFHTQNRYWPSPHDRQIQLLGPLNLCLLAGGDVLSNRLRGEIHILGRHLLASVIERGLLAHQSLHAAHPWGELRVYDIQFDIGGELAVMQSVHR